MMTTLLTTKLYLPTPRSDLVLRPRLIKQLNTGLSCKFTLISAPAGFGKSTLLSAWVQQAEPRPRIAWLSLDEGDNDLTRFLIYFVAALQTIESDIGQGELVVLQSPGAVNIEAVLTSLLNEIAEFPDDLVLILDDYHVIESEQVDKATALGQSRFRGTSDNIRGVKRIGQNSAKGGQDEGNSLSKIWPTRCS